MVQGSSDLPQSFSYKVLNQKERPPLADTHQHATFWIDCNLIVMKNQAFCSFSVEDDGSKKLNCPCAKIQLIFGA